MRISDWSSDRVLFRSDRCANSCGRSDFAGDAPQIIAQHIVILRDRHQEIVMPKLRFDAGIRDVAIRIDQRLDDLARARWRETPVAGECDHEEARTGAGKRLIENGRAEWRERGWT